MPSIMAGIRSWHKALCSLLLLVYLPACTSWRPGAPTPAQFIASERPELIRVTRNDGSTFTLSNPRVAGDTLFGRRPGGLVQGDSTRNVALPLSDMRQVAVRHTNIGGTLALVGVGLIVVVVIGCASSKGNDFYDPC